MFFHMATFIPFRNKTTQTFPLVRFNTFEKLILGGGGQTVSLFGSAWEGRGLAARVDL